MSTRVLAATSSAVVFTAALVSGAPYAVAMMLAVLVAIAGFDAMEYRIPNTLAGFSAGAALSLWGMNGLPPVAFLCAAVVLALLWVMWESDLIGGGDVKLLPPVVLAVAAAAPDTVTAVIATGLLVLSTFAIAGLWGALTRATATPVAVGVPLAFWISLPS